MSEHTETPWRQPSQAAPGQPEIDWIEVVRAQARSLRFGSIHVTVHDGRVVHIERIEKLRLPQTLSSH